MKEYLQQIFLYLLYLTPLGYFLSLTKLMDPKYSQGVFVQIDEKKPMYVFVKANPTVSDRFHWFTNGVALTWQSYWVATRFYDIEIVAGYAVFAIIFGIVNIVTAIFPRFPWNSQSKIMSIIIIILILAVFGFVAFHASDYAPTRFNK